MAANPLFIVLETEEVGPNGWGGNSFPSSRNASKFLTLQDEYDVLPDEDNTIWSSELTEESDFSHIKHLTLVIPPGYFDIKEMIQILAPHFRNTYLNELVEVWVERTGEICDWESTTKNFVTLTVLFKSNSFKLISAPINDLQVGLIFSLYLPDETTIFKMEKMQEYRKFYVYNWSSLRKITLGVGCSVSFF